MAFPTNPTDNQVYVKDGVPYKYSSSGNAWTKTAITWGSEQTVAIGDHSIGYLPTSDGKTILVTGLIDGSARRPIVDNTSIRSVIASALSKTLSSSIPLKYYYVTDTYQYFNSTWIYNGSAGYGGNIVALIFFT